MTKQTGICYGVTMKQADAIFYQTLEQFLSELSGKNRSPLTIRCYEIDCRQFLSWIQENDLTVNHPADVTKSHLSEYLSSLSDQGLSGRTRARKLAAIRSTSASWLVAASSRPRRRKV